MPHISIFVECGKEVCSIIANRHSRVLETKHFTRQLNAAVAGVLLYTENSLRWQVREMKTEAALHSCQISCLLRSIFFLNSKSPALSYTEQ